jgi:hypothetical protein
MTLVTATSRGCARHGRRAAGRHHDDQSGIGRHLVGAGRAIDYTGTGSTTGINLGPGRPQSGAPNTTTPGTIGTGAAPSGLPGDDPAHPGFPGKVGN